MGDLKKDIKVKDAESCPFSFWHDGWWCSAPRDEEEDTGEDPYCILGVKPAPPCPVRHGMLIELEDEDLVNWE